VHPHTLLPQMAAVHWSVGELESQHNAYVDTAVAMMTAFSHTLREVRTHTGPSCTAAEARLWDSAVMALHMVLLTGLGDVTRCSNEGRSLMQLDHQQLCTALAPLTPRPPGRPAPRSLLPGAPLLDAYIKAFYLPEVQLRHWLTENMALYDRRFLANLLACCGHVSASGRGELLRLIGDSQ